jgi:microcompartment protein CcmK/EutM
MRIARVVGNVVSTIKDEGYYGYKLMIIEYLDENNNPEGVRQIAFDAGQAGVGDIVLVNVDGGAANMLLDKEIIADLTICGVLDSITYNGKTEKMN